jgi:hypothetical protein
MINTIFVDQCAAHLNKTLLRTQWSWFLPPTTTNQLQAFRFGDHPSIQMQLQKVIHHCQHDSWQTVPRCWTYESGLTVCNGLQIRTVVMSAAMTTHWKKKITGRGCNHLHSSVSYVKYYHCSQSLSPHWWSTTDRAIRIRIEVAENKTIFLKVLMPIWYKSHITKMSKNYKNELYRLAENSWKKWNWPVT